jgi:hypothetical protein
MFNFFEKMFFTTENQDSKWICHSNYSILKINIKDVINGDIKIKNLV